MQSASIMVVEDDRIVARDIQGRLEGLDYEVPAVVSTGEEAVKEASARMPDLVLMDIRLTGQCDGIEAARRINQKGRIPIIYLTAYSDDDTLQRAGKTAAYGYVLKPCETRRLQVAIEIALCKHRSEQEARRQQELLEQLFQEVPLALITVDSQARVILCNDGACEILGCEPEDSLQSDVRELLHLQAEDGKTIDIPVERIFRDDRQILPSSPAELVDRRGQRKKVEFCGVPIHLPGQQSIRAAAFLIEDVSRRQWTHAREIHAESFRMISQAASGIAHHYNNLLTVIEGYSQLLKQGWETQEELQNSLSRIIEASRRATYLTSQLMGFSREQCGRPEWVSVHASIREALSIAGPMLGSNIQVEPDLQSKREKVLADPNHLREIWAHVLLNSRDAMPDGGLVTIKTRNIRRENRDGLTGGDLDEAIEVRLCDRGFGMDAETSERAFDPFFTTKEVGQGIGLGLSTVYCHVRQMGGTVRIESRLHRGTCVVVTLPLQPEAPQTELYQGADESPSSEATASILVVDDEESLRNLAVRLLQRQGYDVVAMAGGSEAVEAIRHDPERFDLVVLDVIMPGMDGRDVAQALQQIREDLPILFTSGCDASAILDPAGHPENFKVLPKPWQPNRLVDVVGRMLSISDK